MIDIVTISSKGQLVIPKRLREDVGFAEQDEVLIVSDEGKIIIEKISKDKAKKNLRTFLEIIGNKSEKLKISEEDIEKEVRAMRNEKKSSSRH